MQVCVPHTCRVWGEDHVGDFHHAEHDGVPDDGDVRPARNRPDPDHQHVLRHGDGADHGCHGHRGDDTQDPPPGTTTTAPKRQQSLFWLIMALKLLLSSLGVPEVCGVRGGAGSPSRATSAPPPSGWPSFPSSPTRQSTNSWRTSTTACTSKRQSFCNVNPAAWSAAP